MLVGMKGCIAIVLQSGLEFIVSIAAVGVDDNARMFVKRVHCVIFVMNAYDSIFFSDNCMLCCTPEAVKRMSDLTYLGISITGVFRIQSQGHYLENQCY